MSYAVSPAEQDGFCQLFVSYLFEFFYVWNIGFKAFVDPSGIEQEHDSMNLLVVQTTADLTDVDMILFREP
jgi:hypothetical protein